MYYSHREGVEPLIRPTLLMVNPDGGKKIYNLLAHLQPRVPRNGMRAFWYRFKAQVSRRRTGPKFSDPFLSGVARVTLTLTA
ncbi:hypothetical protein C5O19_24510 [Siphonobacter curvatus]|uniref:Uncharacterized protein n=1 Tax=Siphonobacter curvatus TaxID=2094562 RepID=A0A2S7IF10_9BACT|nr:hypothetical protein C5O19_24510 [Siphonobacter curvatus]